MKRRNKLGLLALFLFVNITVSLSQVDTAFWFAAPWITAGHAGKTPLALQIATFGNPTTVRLRQPAGTYDTTFLVPANTNFTKYLNHLVIPGNIIENTPANTVLNRGLKISSNFPMTVTYDVITITNNPETYSIKGQNGLGYEFLCPFQQESNNGIYSPQPKSQITIVATQPNTVVWITPKCAVIGHPANTTFSVLLQYGQSYNVENATHLTSIPGNNLAGSVVVANKPIAVTVSDDSVASIGGCRDLMGDQLVPVDIIGDEYIVNKGGLNANEAEGAYIVATVNQTSVTINDGVTSSVMLNKGDSYFYKVTQPLTYIKSDKNIYVMDVSGFGCEKGEAILPPLNCAGSNQVSFTRNNTQNFYLNVLCKTSAINTFTLNGSTTLVPASVFTIVPGTSGQYSGAQIGFTNTAVITVTTANLLENNQDVFALGIFHGGSTSGCLFHYMSSFLRRTTIAVQTPTAVCVSPGVQVPLTGTISGGAITGYWTTTGGTGTFGAYTSTVNTISTVYTLSNADTLLSNITFSLISTGCKPDTNYITVPINQRPKVSVGTGTTICKNNLVPIQLTGNITNALTGAWATNTSTNPGFINPGINISYTPTPADLAAGTIIFTLTSQGNPAGCSATSRTLAVNFIDPPNLTGFDDNICSNTQSVVLTSTVVGSSNTPTWSTTNGTGFFVPSNVGVNPTYSVSSSDYSLTAINFIVTLNPGLPCSIVSDNVQLTMRPAPVATAPADFTVCANANLVTLNGSVGGSASTGTWTTLNGTGAFNTNPPPPSTTYTMSFGDMAIGTLTYVLEGGPSIYPNCPNVYDTLKVAVLAAPVVAVNSNTSVCENAPIALTGTITGFTNTGAWFSTGTGAFSPTNTALGAQYFPSQGDVANGSVTLTLLSTNNFSCPAQSNSFVANFIDAPQASFIVPPKGICINSGIPFTSNSQNNGTSNLTYAWNFGDGVGSSSSSNPVYTYTNTGQYLVTLTVTGTNTMVIPNVQCPDTVMRNILIHGLPLADFTFSNACQGEGTKFKDGSGEIAANIMWQFGDGSPVATLIKDPLHTYTIAGIYNVTQTVTSNQGCINSASKSVTVNPQPVAEFGMTNDPTIALEPVYFSDFSAPTGSISSWLWTFGDEGTGDGPSPTHVYNNTGVYVITLTVFDNNGCRDTISKEIQVQILPQVPTAFTPNHDNNNDLLFVKGGPFEKITFRVYNNWGELLFETNDQSKGWDGTKNGKDQPVGVYVWTLVVDMYNNRQVKKNGDVTIIR